MPRDSSGNYTLPIGNPVIDGTTIDTNWANPTMADIAVQLNNVLTRDGLLSPVGSMYFVDGTQALPGITFAAAHGTGFWRDPTQMGVSWQGVTKQVWNAAGSTAIGSLVIENGFLTAKRYAAPSVILLQRADGIVGAPVAVAGGQANGMWITRAYDGAAYRDIANISMFNAASPAAGSSPGYITFNTTPVGSNAPAERMRIMDYGSVGIGDGTGGAPAALLDIFKGAAGSAVPALRLLSNNGGFSPGSYAGLAYYWNLSAGAAESTLVYGNTANSFLAFGHHNGTSYTERMRINAAGNVGIGVPPSNWGSTYRVFESYAFSMVGTNSGLIGYHGMNIYNDGTNFRYVNAGLATLSGYVNGVYIWYTALTGLAGAVAPITERMRLSNDGGVSVGRASMPFPTMDNTSGVALSGAGEIAGIVSGGASLYLNRVGNDGAVAIFFRGAGVVGSIGVTGAATAYNTTSDYRLKSNVADFTGGALLDSLRPRTWRWPDGSSGVGFVAHEIAEVMSSAVTGAKDAEDEDGKPIYQQMSYSSPELITALVAAVKDLRARVAALGG